MSVDKVVERVKALMQQTVQNGCTEAEAQNAAAHAQRMLAQHNLSAAEVEAADDPEGTTVQVGEHEEVLLGKTLVRWRGQLMYGACAANGCDFFVGWRGDRRNFVIVGTERGSRVARALYEVLCDSVDRLARAGVPPGEGARAYRNAFRLGCSMRLRQRLEAEALAARRDAEAEGGHTAGLVRVDQTSDALARFMGGLKLRTVSGGSCSSQAGWQAGYIAGGSVSLTTNALGES